MKIAAVVALALFAFGACASTQDVLIQLPEGLDREGLRIQVALIGNCLTQRLDETAVAAEHIVEFESGAMAEPLGEVPSGTYGLFAQAFGPGCRIVAAGCSPVRVEVRGGETLRVTLGAIDANECAVDRTCLDDRCVSPGLMDAGMDGGSDVYDAFRDAGNDTPDTNDAGFDALDTNDAGFDAPDTNDAGFDAGPTCTCADPLDGCVRGTCIREDLTCNVLNPCPEGYDCRGNECTCADINLCGAACVVDSHCVGGTVCDTFTNRCRSPLTCLSDPGCAAGEICTGNAFEEGQCSSPGAAADGMTCDTGADCASGFCLTNVCVEQCLRNSDCPAAAQCRLDPTSFSQLACLPAIGECDMCGVDDACGERRCQRHCDVGADCETGEACLGDPIVGLAICAPGACGPVERQTNSGLCYLMGTCWLGSSCPNGYDCTPYSRIRDGRGLCARTP